MESLKGLINSLPTDDETIRPNEVEEARRRVQDVFQRMDNVGSFGKNFRSGNMPSTNEESDKKLREANKDDSSSQSLLDISNTFWPLTISTSDTISRQYFYVLQNDLLRLLLAFSPRPAFLRLFLLQFLCSYQYNMT